MRGTGLRPLKSRDPTRSLDDSGIYRMFVIGANPCPTTTNGAQWNGCA